MNTSRFFKMLTAAVIAGAVNLTAPAAAGAQGLVTTSAFGCELDAAIAQGTATQAQFTQAVARLPRDPRNSDIVLLANGVRASAREILAIAAAGNGVPAGNVASAPDSANPANFVAHLQFSNNQRAMSHGDFIHAVFSGVSTGLFGTVDLCAPPPAPPVIVTHVLLGPVIPNFGNRTRPMPAPVLSASPVLQQPQALPIQLPTPGDRVAPAGGGSLQRAPTISFPCALDAAIQFGTATQAQIVQAIARLPRDPNNPDIVLLHNGVRARASQILSITAAGNGIPAATVTSEPDRTNPDNFIAYRQFISGRNATSHAAFVSSIFYGLTTAQGGPVDLCGPAPVLPASPVLQQPQALPIQLPTPGDRVAPAGGGSLQRAPTISFPCALDAAIQFGTATQAQIVQAIARLPRDPNNPDIVLLHNGVRARASQILSITAAGNGIPAATVTSEPDRTNPDNFIAYRQFISGRNATSHAAFVSSIFYGLTTAQGGPVDLCGPAPASTTPTSPPVTTPVSFPVINGTEGPGTLRIVISDSSQSPSLPASEIRISNPVSMCWTFNERVGLWERLPATLNDPACTSAATINPNLNITDDIPSLPVSPITDTASPTPTAPMADSINCWTFNERTGLWERLPATLNDPACASAATINPNLNITDDIPSLPVSPITDTASPTPTAPMADSINCWTFNERTGLWERRPETLNDPACTSAAIINPNLNITDDGPSLSVSPITDTASPTPTAPMADSIDCWSFDERTGLWVENPNCPGSPAPTPDGSESVQTTLPAVEEIIDEMQSDSAEIVDDIVDEAIRETVEEAIEVCLFEEECEF